MTEDRAIVDVNEIVAFALAAQQITKTALNGLSDADVSAPELAALKRGGTLYLHVQLVPEFAVLLMLDPAPGDPAQPPRELARVTSGEASKAVKRVLN